LAAATALIFGAHGLDAGLHQDDFGFHRVLRGPFSEAWPLMRDYVPGRNLHVLYSWLLYHVLGSSPRRMHAAGLALDAACALLTYALLRQRRHASAWALIGAGLFLVMPNRGETHYWTTAIAMNLTSTALLLLAFLAAGSPWRPSRRWPLALFLYALALFDYDQVFFLWPLLVWHGASARPRDEPLVWPAGFAAACAALNCAHLALRLFWPRAKGGRPVPTFGLFWGNVGHEWGSVLVPLHKLPAWPSLATTLGGPAVTAAALAVLAAAWLYTALRQPRDGDPSPREPLFAAAWILLAYLPNDFWYQSPRHNMLPCVGVALALAWAAPRLAERPRWGRLAAALAWLAFGVGAAQGLADGFGWAAGARLFETFRAEAPLLAPSARALFVLGAPTSAARGPAFEHPQEASFLYAQDRDAIPAGSLNVVPTRTGFFYDSETEIWGRDLWRFEPYPGSSILAFSPPDRFEKAGALDLRPPVGQPVHVTLGAGTAVPIDVPLWLVGSRAVPRARNTLAETAPGLGIVSASMDRNEDNGRLRLTWRADAPRPDFAWTFVLLAADGSALFEPVYRLKIGSRLQPPMLWPVLDDLRPSSHWSATADAEQTVLFRMPGGLAQKPARLRVTIFERRDGESWPRAGRVSEVPLS
jgi:hypothetical protein